MGKHSIIFKRQPRIVATYTMGGPKEADSHFGKHIHQLLSDERFGEDTFEKAECKMLSNVIEKVIKKAGLNHADIDALVSGDLLNQIISASFAARDFDIPYIGIYNACSTLSEGFAISACLVDGGYMHKIVVATGSHFATAERQYRYPLELGCTRPPQSQWTVTGGGAFVVSDEGDYPKIVGATFGKVVDFGITDANNMGAAMAPAAADTLCSLFDETKTRPEDYDLILTGDLGALGSRLVKKLVRDKGYDMERQHADCGEMIYNIDEQTFQGGSGAGCSAVVFGSYIYDKLKKKKLKKIIFMATGALLSTVSTQQGESIPCVAHAVIVES